MQHFYLEYLAAKSLAATFLCIASGCILAYPKIDNDSGFEFRVYSALKNEPVYTVFSNELIIPGHVRTIFN